MKFNVPLIMQFSETECGVAALAMLFSYYRVYIPFEVIREKCGVSRDGCKVSTLIQVAREYQFNADAYSVEIDEIQLFCQPVIAFWNFNHYVVVTRMIKNQVDINDPARGKITVSMKEFDKAFTGVIVVLSRDGGDTGKMQKSILALYVYELLSMCKREWKFLLVCMMLVVIYSLLGSILSTIFIDFCVINEYWEWVPCIAFISFLFYIAVFWSTVLQKWTEFKVYTKASMIKSKEVIAHLLQLPLFFYSIRQKNEVISILIKTEWMVNVFFKNVILFSANLLSILVSFVFMIKIDSYLTVISFFIVIPMSIFFYFLYKKNIIHEKYSVYMTGKLYAYVLSRLRNLETIKACSLERMTWLGWQDLFSKKMIAQDRVNHLIIGITAFYQWMDMLTMLVILFFGGKRVYGGFLSVGLMMAYYSLHLFFYKNINSMIKMIEETQRAGISYGRIQDIKTVVKDSRFLVTETALPSRNEKILCCKDVFFHYNPHEPPLLKKINLEVKSGQQIAIVGETGSGKSTLSRLLCSFYQPSSGKILFNGVNISLLTAKQLAENFSFISQDISLFSGTIYDNLTLWRNDYCLDKIYEAISLSSLDELIRERGLYGEVEENGNNLSGGEKQRIDIARALIQNTPVLILDEATSALDVQTESKVITYFRKIGKTMIYIAHRLSTVQHCDQIIVLDKGMIIEQGNHHQLLGEKGHYYRLVCNE